MSLRVFTVEVAAANDDYDLDAVFAVLAEEVASVNAAEAIIVVTEDTMDVLFRAHTPDKVR